MSGQLLLLSVVVPLLGAPVCVLLGGRRRSTYVSMLVCWITFGLTAAVLRHVVAHGEIRYNLGGWAPPIGIEYRVDLLGAFVLAFVALIGAIVMTAAPASLRREVQNDRHYLFNATYLLAVTGLLGIVATGDLFNVFVFLEISSLSSYALISMGRERQALTAAFQYLIMGTLGATFILIAIGLIYMMTGTLNMADAARLLPAVADSRTILVAFAFLTAGLALKIALFPLHLWLPSAYTFAPSLVSAFLAATSTKVSIYLLLRVMFTVFGTEFIFQTVPLEPILIGCALIAMFYGSIVAFYRVNFKRLLAYSSVAQIGYIALGIGLGNTSGLTGAIVHVFNHGITKCALFLALAAMLLRHDGPRRQDLQGVGRTMPVTTLLWVLAGLSLIGVPGTAGFISKWYLVTAAVEKGWWWVAALILASSLIAVAYVWRFVELAYFTKSTEPYVREAPLSMLIPIAVLVGMTIYFGLRTEWTAGLAATAAQQLLGGPP